MKITEIPVKKKEQEKIRVAAYARVSADKDAAFHSLEAQTEYYEQYVTKQPTWELVGIYSDNGISGTTINRPEFLRMLKDCRSGRVDMIVTKSIARFARNTVTLLETIRELKTLNIDVYFEKEDMHSVSPDGELLITLLAMYAEEEARSVSENQKWRIKKMFEAGRPSTGKMLGYRLIDGQLRVVPDEAAIVRRIYELYLSGMGHTAIAETLLREGILPPKAAFWPRDTIHTILTNEKYTGNLLLQKFYHDDFRTKRKIRNRGERRMYYVEDSHEAIIDRETFNAVQREIKSRQRRFTTANNDGDDTKNLFNGLIHCGRCGYRYVRKNTNGKYNKTVWMCGLYFQYGTFACKSHKLPESILLEKTKAVLQTEQLTKELIAEKIVGITAADKTLCFHLNDGSSVTVQWDYISRKYSWTPEMREAARQRTLEKNRKEREKNAESDNN